MELVATIEKIDTGWLCVSFTYHAEAKDTLMRMTGKGNYRYQPETHCWHFRSPFLKQILKVLDDYDFHIEDNVSQPVITQKVGVNPWADIFKSVDNELAHKLYRAATLILHPDAGGNNRAMQLLNDGWRTNR